MTAFCHRVVTLALISVVCALALLGEWAVGPVRTAWHMMSAGLYLPCLADLRGHRTPATLAAESSVCEKLRLELELVRLGHRSTPARRRQTSDCAANLVAMGCGPALGRQVGEVRRWQLGPVALPPADERGGDVGQVVGGIDAGEPA